MILEIATVIGLARQCAPAVAAETLVSLVHTESRFNPYAIGVNAKGLAAFHPADRISAAAAARSLIAQGYNIDLGLGQINSANLKWLGLSVDDAFDPCRNLAAAGRLLSNSYLSVVRSSPSTEAAIATAMSLYNTGSRLRGFGNGYVSRVYSSSRVVIPLIKRGIVPTDEPAPVRPLRSSTPTALPAPLPTSQVEWTTSAGAQTAALMVFGGASSRTPKGQVE